MRSPRISSLLIAGYLTVQVAYPIRGLVEDKFDTFGGFTWNMYSQSYHCAVRYAVVDGSAEHPVADYEKYFKLREKTARVFHRDALPRFHEFLCRQLAEEGKSGRLTGFVRCTKNGNESEILVRERVNICAAANYAVTQ